MKIILFASALALLCFSPFTTKAETAQPRFTLYDPGTQFPVKYEDFGTFSGIDTSSYSYTITDNAGLSAAVGEGIYPNTTSIYADPEYQRYLAEGRLDGDHWNFIDSPDPQADFYKWATAPESDAVRLLYMGQALVNAGLIEHAIKAYYALVVNFPDAKAGGEYYWYVAPGGENMLNYLCREYPEVGLKIVNERIKIQNDDDSDPLNDIVTVNPGTLVPYTVQDRIADIPDLGSLPVIQTRGSGKVQLVKFSNGQWQLRVNNAPFIIRGVSYFPTKVGGVPQDASVWQFSDENYNGEIDTPYDVWADKNRNNVQDADELSVGDFQLMKEMGCNAIRMFHSASPDNKTYLPGDYNKQLLRDMHAKYGIWVIMGDFFGAYGVGSGALWPAATDYTDPVQRESMKNVVKAMVLDHKDEPYVLLWLLGNENNCGASNTNAAAYPKEYAEFLNEVAEMIHQLDPNHPVAVGNLILKNIQEFALYAPSLDIIGANNYPGRYGFGISLYKKAQDAFDRPILFTEYGADAYQKDVGIDEPAQAEYDEGCWKDIVYNAAGWPGPGNVIGGVLSEWLDEWWKDPADSYFTHSPQPQFFMGTAPDGWSHEEWYGICGQGDGTNSPFLRDLRQPYYSYEKMWAPSIRRDTLNGNVILSWGTYPGLNYDIFYSNDSINWSVAQNGIPASADSQASWIDDGTYTGSHPDNILIRYYRVYINGAVPPRMVLDVNTGGNISGKVLLDGRANHSDLITFELRLPGKTTALKKYQVKTAADGSYSLNAIPQGTFDWTAKGFNSLRSKKTNVIVDTAKSTADTDFFLLEGDASGDNYINRGDSKILNAAWSTSEGQRKYDPRADFNGDKTIGSADLYLLNKNWLKNGDK